MRKEMGIVDGSGEGELGNGSHARHRHDALYRLVGFASSWIWASCFATCSAKAEYVAIKGG